jgi:hypothetical protein
MKNKGKHKFVERSETKTKRRKRMIGNFFRGVMPKKMIGNFFRGVMPKKMIGNYFFFRAKTKTNGS